MNWRSIGVLVVKDISLFFRNRLFAVITMLGLVAFTVIYFLMPSSVDETFEIGLYAPLVPPALEVIQEEEEGLEIIMVESEDSLQKGVVDGEYLAGLVLPDDVMDVLLQREILQVKVYFASDTPGEIRDVVDIIITEMVFLQIGQPLDIEWNEEILGPDMAGSQIPQRDRIRPLLAVMIIMFETFGLAGLVSEEIQRRTAWALLVTPLTVRDLFTAKAIMGILLAFVQAVLFLVIVRGMGEQPLIIITSLFMGAVLLTGFGFIMASLGKDILSVTAWGLPVIIVLSIPAFGVLVPGAASDWIKVIPSYYLTDTIYRVSHFEASWSDVWGNLLILMGFNVAIFSVGILALRRKLQ